MIRQNVWFLAALWMALAFAASLLIATGITFGTISALFGLQNRIIHQRQYTLLVTAVILSAIVPTLIAQKFFQPSVDAMRAWGQRYRTRVKAVSEEDLP
jgi:hypothetical protein